MPAENQSMDRKLGLRTNPLVITRAVSLSSGRAKIGRDFGSVVVSRFACWECGFARLVQIPFVASFSKSRARVNDGEHSPPTRTKSRAGGPGSNLIQLF
jgi:hypothetical protein